MDGQKTRYKYELLTRIPMTEAVLLEEGGDWVPFATLKRSSRDHMDGGRAACLTIHAIRFVGGHIWDAVNGWRDTDASSTDGGCPPCS